MLKFTNFNPLQVSIIPFYMFKKIMRGCISPESPEQQTQCIYFCVSIFVCRESQRDAVVVVKFVIRNWLTRVWRLTSLKLCCVSQQAGDPGDLMV